VHFFAISLLTHKPISLIYQVVICFLQEGNDMAKETNIQKLARLYTEDGFTKEQAATEMANNNTPYAFAVKVLHAMK